MNQLLKSFGVSHLNLFMKKIDIDLDQQKAH